MIRRNWTHDELMVVFNIYCRLPFGQLDSRNPKIVEMSSIIGRTPSAVSMKLCNFASFDPIHHARGVKGLANSSAADKEIWAEFNADWEQSVTKSNALLIKMREETLETELDLIAPKGPTDVERIVRQRRGQRFFRQAVLASYGEKCCITGTPLPELLIASHILPWSIYPEQRLNPRNGLCLSAIHDAAFDNGLITLDDQYRLVLSYKLRRVADTSKSLSDIFIVYEGKQITLPGKFLPEQDFLKIHRDTIFK